MMYLRYDASRRIVVLVFLWNRFLTHSLSARLSTSVYTRYTKNDLQDRRPSADSHDVENSTEFFLNPPDSVLQVLFHKPRGEGWRRATPLSSKGKSAMIYTLMVGKTKRMILKVPRNRDVERELHTEATMSNQLAEQGFNSLRTEVVLISFWTEDHALTYTRALLKPFLFGNDLSDVVLALGREDKTFDTDCLVERIRDVEYSPIYSKVLGLELPEMRIEGMFPMRAYGPPDKGKETIARLIQLRLQCFFGRVAQQLLFGKPQLILSDLSAANFMWATEKTRSKDQAENYDLWLVDALYFPAGSIEYDALLGQCKMDFECVWQRIYVAQWEMGGLGQCASAAWQKFVLPDSLSIAGKWSRLCEDNQI